MIAIHRVKAPDHCGNRANPTRSKMVGQQTQVPRRRRWCGIAPIGDCMDKQAVLRHFGVARKVDQRKQMCEIAMHLPIGNQS